MPVLALLLLAADLQVDPVVAKAFAFADHLDELRANLAFTVTTRFDTLDANGQVTGTDELVMRVTRRDGEETRSIVRATKEGRELDAEERKALEADNSEGKRFTIESPFRAANRARHRFTVGTAGANGLVRVDFTAAGERDGHTNEGYGLVEAATGAPRRLEFHPSSLPIYVQQLDATLVFDPRAPDRPVPLRLEVSAEGGLLFVKRRLHTVSTFTDLGPPPPKSP